MSFCLIEFVGEVSRTSVIATANDGGRLAYGVTTLAGVVEPASAESLCDAVGKGFAEALQPLRRQAPR
jgi:hypothetical protein